MKTSFTMSRAQVIILSENQMASKINKAYFNYYVKRTSEKAVIFQTNKKIPDKLLI